MLGRSISKAQRTAHSLMKSSSLLVCHSEVGVGVGKHYNGASGRELWDAASSYSRFSTTDDTYDYIIDLLFVQHEFRVLAR